MQVRHELTGLCACPIDGATDVYAITVEADRVIQVEDILAFTKMLATDAMFQEDYTARLARAIGARVTTIGNHSGVKTTCCAG